ncbi:porin [Pasteurella skyensis]|uniref:Porin n=1 Tax=Phocoenobacter skyensis TaxID=97481 RepID=A0AAJ6P392_9PAST|nr:porin [Pasteurella skyensis]MDP8171394.1 porin [Pasteurella skyensis]MDP8175518.1 porin [Pasteurella skyensis]
MKKTLIALTVAALASTSASALTVYSENGSTVDVTGAVKMVLQKEKVGDVSKKTVINKKDAKLGVKAKYDFGTDAYALAAYEYSFLNTDETSGEVKKAYIGVGSKSAGQLTFGLQNTFADGVGASSFDNAFGVRDKFIPGDADNSIAYRYMGVEGLELGLDYVLSTETSKAWYDLGAKYSTGDITVAFAFSQAKKTPKSYKGYDFFVDKATALDTSVSYKMDNVTFGLDLGYAKFDDLARAVKDADGKITGYKAETGDVKAYYVSPGVKVAFGDAAVYGNYTYTKAEDAKWHGINLGAEYTLVKNALVFAEFNYSKEKDSDTGAVKAIGVGMKVEW